ncbi:hypothetical protein SteCoe_22274 [Stentor coeruleus]|uniref:Uncharacterized protein n=1 Tax=Stentor coeruleus TaxID=5963 RepID=A0A1R2BMN7_9CILI|nr:hypothetical protein SteCoe_22274 [Stentor coeruleus]
MTARVEELLSQLEKIDFRKSLESSPKNQSNKDQQVKIKSNDSLNPQKSTENAISSQTLSDNNLQTEIQELQVQLKVLLMQKKKEKINICKQCDKISAQVTEQKIELEKVEKELKALETRSETIEKVLKEKQYEKLEAFRYALKPLEDTANTIIEEKEMLKKKNEDLNQRLGELDELKIKKSEELKKLQKQKTELISNKEKLSNYLAEIKETEYCNYKEYSQEIETKEILSAIRDRKAKCMKALKDMERKLAEVEAQIESSDKKTLYVTRPEDYIPVTLEAEIDDMEAYLNLVCKDLGVPNLLYYIKEQMTKKPFQIDEMLIKNQMELIEDKEMQTEEAFRFQKNQLESKIFDLRRATEEQEVEFLTLHSNNLPSQDIEQALQKNKKILNELRKEAQNSHRIHKAKMQAIAKWKDQNRGKLLISDKQIAIDDEEVVKIFKRELQKSVIKLDQWKSIENVINKYIEKINEKGRSFQNLLSIENERFENQKKMKSTIKELEAIRTSLLIDKDMIQKEFGKTLALEKTAMKKFENVKIELDQERNKMIEKITEKNMKSNKSSLLQIQRTYGDKAIKKIRDKESQSVKENQEKQKDEIKKKLEGLNLDIMHWESLITKTESSINENLKPEIDSIDQEVVKIKQELVVISQQLKILNDAEEELSAKFEFLMESKKRDIQRTLHRTLEIHGGDVDSKKITRLTQIRDKKAAAVQQLLEEKEKIEQDFIEKIKDTELEEFRLKAKISVAQENPKSPKIPPDSIPIKPVIKIQHLQLESDKKFFKDEIEKSESPIEEIKENLLKTEEPTIEFIESKDDQETTEIDSVTTESGINIDLEDLSSQDQEFFHVITPLLQGTSIYKKLSQRNSLQFPDYDPLENDNPESFGYGLRSIKLNKALTKIEFRVPHKPGIENSILVESLLAPIIPKHTSEMIKSQKKNWLSEAKDEPITPAINKKYKLMKTSGLMNYSDPAFILKSYSASTYLFFITLEKGGRVELVAKGYSTFKQWVDGVNALIKFRKQLARLRYKIA